MTEEQFFENFRLLEMNYGKELDKKIVEIWYNEFKGYNIKRFKNCVIETIKNEQFFPTINQVKAYKDTNFEYVGEDGFTYRNGHRVL